MALLATLLGIALSLVVATLGASNLYARVSRTRIVQSQVQAFSALKAELQSYEAELQDLELKARTKDYGPRDAERYSRLILRRNKLKRTLA